MYSVILTFKKNKLQNDHTKLNDKSSFSASFGTTRDKSTFFYQIDVNDSTAINPHRYTHYIVTAEHHNETRIQ